MSALIFDTLKLSKSLQSEFTPAQADALASALASSAHDTVATKARACVADVGTSTALWHRAFLIGR